ncbi:acyl-ACP desaturase [Aldersonia kunmingensis]|uniref:acyl-ACP desaturase n=1 Tax=Aldersonia kunmingensis TaxID=408066 RepID=UPI000832276C|nr:acyl-ACP desaturase [Aldersonia kunmingensis]
MDALAFEIELNLRRHVEAADIWQPHELIPWSDARSFAAMGGEDWAPEQSTLGEVEKLALTVGVLVADNMPSYHREIARNMFIGVWWRWVNRWTAEEFRHAVLLRNYLVTTRAVDPVELERIRMQAMTDGYNHQPMHLIEMLTNCAFEEAASALRHRNTAAFTSDPVVAAICNRIALDDELQSELFADLVAAALKLTPEQTVAAVASRIPQFVVPMVELPGRDAVAELADAGIYDPRREPELVFAPLLRRWNIAERPEFAELLAGVGS